MKKLIANIHAVTCSSGKLSLAMPQGFLSPEFNIGDVFKDYNNKKVNLSFKVFNSLNEIEMKKASLREYGKELKLTEKKGTLHVDNQQKTTDLDSWFESTVSIKESFHSSEEFSLNDFLSSKSGKVLYLEIRAI